MLVLKQMNLDTLTSEMSKNAELIEKMERKQKELETLKNNASRKK